MKYIEQDTLLSYELLTGPKYSAWLGYSFEKLCLKHAKQIAFHLGFGGIKYTYGSWFRNNIKPSAQIDLLFERGDNVNTVCEIKNGSSLPSNLVDAFEKKLHILSQYYQKPVQKVLILGQEITVPIQVKDYFDKIINHQVLFL